MNLLKLAELLTISRDEAFNFYSEVRQFSRLGPSTGLVLKNTLKYLQENDKATVTPQEVAAFLDEHEAELETTPIRLIEQLEVLPLEKLTVPKRVVSPSRHPLVSPDVLDEERRRLIREFRTEYTAEFKQREDTAFYDLVKKHLENKGVTGDPHVTVRGLNDLTKAKLHFLTIGLIYTAADAKRHRGMDYRNEFLQSHYWRIISEYLRLWQRDYRHQCPICDEPCPKFTEVHHKHYNNHGWEHEHLEDLEVICRSCHSDISWLDEQRKILDGRKSHFELK